MLIPFFKMYEDETIYSAVCRYHFLSGHLTYTHTLTELFENKKKRIHPYLPSEVHLLTEELGNNVNDLIQKHTLQPLFSLFDPVAGAAIKKAMCSVHGNPVHKANLPHFKITMFTGHKFCPLCVNSDLDKYGCGLWHLHHQVPGISACSLHCVRLIGIENGDYVLDRQLQLPPIDGIAVCATEAEIALSKFSYILLDYLKADKRVLLPTSSTYQYYLMSQGLSDDNGRLKAKKIINFLKEYWKDLPCNLVVGVPEKLFELNFFGAILWNKSRSPTHPIKHLLLACWLFKEKPEIYFEANKAILKPKFNKLDNMPALDVQIVMMLKRGKSMNAIEQQLCKSRCYIRRVAELNNIVHRTNSQKNNLNIKHLVRLQAQIGHHRKAIAEALNVGIGYVEQVISNTTGLVSWRKRLKEMQKIVNASSCLRKAIKENPGWLRKDVKKYYSKEYFCLYHHDRKLLERLLPAKSKPAYNGKNWALEDARLAAEIALLKDIHQMSIGEIDHLVGGHRCLLRHLNKLPQTYEVLNKLGKLNGKKIHYGK